MASRAANVRLEAELVKTGAVVEVRGKLSALPRPASKSHTERVQPWALSLAERAWVGELLSTVLRREAGHFVCWAISQRLNRSLRLATGWAGPRRPLDEEQCWDQVKGVLHDDSIDTGDCVAGLLLLLLYGQGPCAFSRLTLDDVETIDGEVRLRVGPTPVVLAEPLDSLVLHVVANRRGHAVLGDLGTSCWLLPGGRLGRPISADGLNQRFRRIGIPSGLAQSCALLRLAAELPAALLARMLLDIRRERVGVVPGEHVGR